MRHRGRKASAAAVATLAVALAGGPARAEHVESFARPGEPARLFPADFPLPLDAQAEGEISSWSDRRMGGWGGAYPGAESCPTDRVPRTPVVFVHGTTEDASFWTAADNGSTTVNVRKTFLDAGWCPAELWAVSYTGARGYFTYNDANAEEVWQFFRNVMSYTGATRIDVVAHSLGVTVVRKALRNHFTDAPPSTWLRRFVASAGANHGTTTCRGLGNREAAGTRVFFSHVCEETEPGSPWLDDLNGVGETPPGPDYLVVYDSVGDNFYQGPDAHSPRLDGACNHDLPGRFHIPVGRGPEAVALFLDFLDSGATPCD